MKKVQLERVLQSLAPLSEPKAKSEQYPTPAAIAAEVVFGAAARGDITGNSVLDLGCGNGVLGIAAKLLGADRVLGVDSDRTAIEVATTNASKAGVDLELRVGNVVEIQGAFDTVLMNPPFGAQSRHADRPFLEAALRGGRVVYTFLNAAAEAFVRRYLESAGAAITDRFPYSFPISHAFDFHRDEERRIEVVLLRVEVAKG